MVSTSTPERILTALRNVALYYNKPSSILSLNSDKIPTLESDGSSYTGVATILFCLWNNSPKQVSPEFDSIAYQWLEYLSIHSTKLSSILEELNAYLESYSYIAGNAQSAVDVIYYYFIYEALRALTPQEKVNLQNVCRWYSLMQQNDNIRRQNEIINFVVIGV